MQLERKFSPNWFTHILHAKPVEQPFVFHSSSKPVHEMIGDVISHDKARFAWEYPTLWSVVYASKVPTDLFGGSSTNERKKMREIHSHLPFMFYQLLSTNQKSWDRLYEALYPTQIIKLWKVPTLPLYIYVLSGKWFLEVEMPWYRNDFRSVNHSDLYVECIYPWSVEVLDVIWPINTPINTHYIPFFEILKSWLIGTLTVQEYIEELLSSSIFPHISFLEDLDKIKRTWIIPQDVRKYVEMNMLRNLKGELAKSNVSNTPPHDHSPVQLPVDAHRWR